MMLPRRISGTPPHLGQGQAQDLNLRRCWPASARASATAAQSSSPGMADIEVLRLCNIDIVGLGRIDVADWAISRVVTTRKGGCRHEGGIRGRVRRAAGAWRVAVVSVRVRIAAVAIFAIALSGVGASSAAAYDEVWLNNQTNVPFTQGSLCLFVGSVPCATEDGGAWMEGSVLAANQANPGINAILQVTGATPASFTTTWSPSGSSNHFTFVAVDPPIGPAFVQCNGSVPGYNCSVVRGLFGYLQQDGSSSSLGARGFVAAGRPALLVRTCARYPRRHCPGARRHLLDPAARHSARTRSTPQQ